ncbi:hypothetical protein LJR039_007207 [Pseudorhodoferax sp. LjRoot39]|uniref:hypothetical protein n=1 Tax=Pseudorhodoferax sp. LjRoot39 TaxID=3342328 RepID=UPI003ECECC11
MQTKALSGTLAAAAVATLLASTTSSAHAQGALTWTTMREAAFNSPRDQATATATAEDHAVLQKLWAKELAGAGTMGNGEPFPSAVLVGNVEVAPSTQLMFSIYSRAGYEACREAANGAKQVYSHWVCPMRVVRLTNGQPSVRDFSGYCMVWGDDQDAPRSANHVEYAYDARKPTLHLRTLEHGKVVSRCSRSLRLD